MVADERPEPKAGEVWRTALGPIQGSEQDGLRPVIVVSNDWFNEYNRRMVLTLPITRTNRGIRYQVQIPAGEGGLNADSVIMCEQVRSIDRIRLKEKLGDASPETLAAVRRNVIAIISDRIPRP